MSKEVSRVARTARRSQLRTRFRTLGGAALAVLALSGLARGQTAGRTDVFPDRETAPSRSFEVPALGAPNEFADDDAGGYSRPVELGLFDTMAESLFGDVYAPNRWRPLPLSTFFTEGWLEPWANAPAGRKGLTPRHGWLGSFNGVFYRLWFTTLNFQNGLSTPFAGNRYTSDFSIFLPLSRRFDLFFGVPFVVSNGRKEPPPGYRTSFGDFQVAPRFLLAETRATTQVLSVVVNVPTGSTATGTGIMGLAPRYEFWTNPGGPWVVRGSGGMTIPLNKEEAPAQTSLVAGLAIGRYFRPHDVPFGDLVFYAACNLNVPLDGGYRSTYVGIGPGTRFHLANNFFLLHYWEFPVTGNRPDQYSAQFSLVKIF